MLVDFAKAGLSDPILVSLDVESKIPESLKLAFLQSRADSKHAVLLHLLKNVVPPGQQTIVFAATRYHVEYLQVLLALAEIPATLQPARAGKQGIAYSLVAQDELAYYVDLQLLLGEL